MAEEFRSSKYINFDSGDVWLPPMVLLRQKSKPWSLPDKLDIFECRVEVWQLGVAVAVLKEMECPNRKGIWSHSAYGLVAIVFSYFEMIGKILNPSSKKRNSASQDFKAGFCDVYPEFRTGSGEPSSDVSQYLDRVRNGMYHLAYTKRGLWIHHDHEVSLKDFEVKPASDLPNKLGFSGTDPVYLMDPHRVTRTIVSHFSGFVSRLREPSPSLHALQLKFEAFFDDFHDAT